jgi:cytochrome o ubiquinol oxidase subunit 1
MGASANVNGFFGVMTMIIAVPTGVKIFNWLFTMYGGRIRFNVPILWSIGFMVTFVIGGMTGVLMAVPPADFQLHGVFLTVLAFAFRSEEEVKVPADQIARFEQANQAEIAA